MIGDIITAHIELFGLRIMYNGHSKRDPWFALTPPSDIDGCIEMWGRE